MPAIHMITKTSSVTNTKLLLATLAFFVAGGAVLITVPLGTKVQFTNNYQNVNNTSNLVALDNEYPNSHLPESFQIGVSTVTNIRFPISDTCESKRDACFKGCLAIGCNATCLKNFQGCLNGQLTGIPLIDNSSNFKWVRLRLKSVTKGTAILKTALSKYSPFFSRDVKRQIFDNITGWQSLSEDDKNFLIRLTHALYLETHHLVPWSLLDYSEEEIISLFTSNAEEIIHFYQDPNVLEGYDGHVESLKDKFFIHNYNYKDFENLFFVADGVIGNEENQEKAIIKIVSWTGRNFVHAYLLNNPEDHPPGDIALDLSNGYLSGLFKSRMVDAGCHSGAKILVTLLRSLNIPAYLLMGEGHGVAFIPTINKYVHGDAITFSAAGLPGEYMLLSVDQAIDGDEEDFFTEATRIEYYLGLDRETRCLTVPSGPYISWPNHTMFVMFGEQFIWQCYVNGNGGKRWQEARERLPEFNLPVDPNDLMRDPYSPLDLRTVPVPIRSLEELNTVNNKKDTQ